jgi:hypothetical protein
MSPESAQHPTPNAEYWRQIRRWALACNRVLLCLRHQMKSLSPRSQNNPPPWLATGRVRPTGGHGDFVLSSAGELWRRNRQQK